MVYLLFIMSFLVSFIALAVVLPGCVETYARYSRSKFVECPEEHKPAVIDVAAGLAATSSAFFPTIRKVRTCSLWPGKPPCHGRCLLQVR